MGISESILNRTIECFENICDDVDCEVKSWCCETHYSSNSPKRSTSKNSNKSDKSDKSEISEI